MKLSAAIQDELRLAVAWPQDGESHIQKAIDLVELHVGRVNARLPFKLWEHGIFFETQVDNKKLVLFSK